MNIHIAHLKKRQGGAAMLIAIVFFMFISLAVIAGLVSPAVRQYKSARTDFNSKQSYFLAESGIEDAFYRIKNNMPITSSETLTLLGESATTTVTTNGTGQKIISTLGDIDGYQRKIGMTLQTGAGVAFNYGLQAGNAGVTIDGGSTLVGNIYSNGDVDGVSATITGSVVAADSTALIADQTNDTPIPPTSSITFRNTAATQDFAQSFEVSSTSLVNKFQFYIKKVGNPSDATVRLVADNSGSPSTSAITIGSVSLSSGLVTTNYGWVDVVLSTQPSLIPGTTYWVVIDNGSQNASNYYMLAANNSYASGTAKTGAYSGSWAATGFDAYFKVYLGGLTSTIGRASYPTGLMVGSAGVGDVWASIVKGTSAVGHMYCTTGTNNNKVCDTSHGTPPPQPLPFSDANIDDWKAEAEAGTTISGNYTVGFAGATWGPTKVTGNLTINGGGTLTLNGTLWVEGNVTVTGGGKIKLASTYSAYSGTIVADGWVSIAGGGSAGSGTPGSFLFVVSTSQCPNDLGCSGNSAIMVSGGAGAIAINAQHGNVALSGAASLNAAVGNSITMTGGSTVTYNSGLASPSFNSGPSGAWNISSWKESQ